MPASTELRWPRRTARLGLRPILHSDLDVVATYRTDPGVTRWVGRATRTGAEVEEHFFQQDAPTLSLVVEHSGHVVGDLMIAVSDAWGQHEVKDSVRDAEARLGWTLAPTHRGQGLMTEAVAEVLRICFEDLAVRRVVAECFEANEASWRLMERLGMRREGHFVAESLHRDLGWIDSLSYALLADEWRAARSA